MMVMNGSKSTNYSNDELSRFIDLITNAIQTELPNQRYARLSTILIPMEFTSLADNDDEQHDIIYVGGNEEVEDQIEDGNEQGQETVMTTPVDQQPNSSHRTLRSLPRVNYRQMNDFYSRESRATLAGSGGNGMDEDYAFA